LPPEAVEPMVADDGPWVQQYEASGWVETLGHLAAEFPKPGTSSAAWSDFVSGSMTLPLAVVSIGAVAALMVPLVLHCCHPKCRSRTGGPPWKSFACACFLCFGLLAVSGALALQTNVASFETASWQLKRAAGDVDMAFKLAQGLNSSGIAVVADLTRLNTDCPQRIQEYLGDSVTDIITQVNGYLTEVGRLVAAMTGTPEQILHLQEQAVEINAAAIWFLAVPWLVVLACCGAIALTVFIIEKAGRKCAKRCERCELPCLGLACVAPAMVLISAVAALELLVGILSSGACLTVDQTTLNYSQASFGADSVGFNTSRYYLAGEGPNPAIEHLDWAQVEIVDAIAWVRHYGDIIATTCPQWGMEGAAISNLETIQYSMNESETLLAPGHVYPYYQVTVHDTLCGKLPAGMARAAVLQVVLGILCLPLLLCTASCVIDGLIDERAQIHGIHNFDLLAQESDAENALD